MAMETIVAFTTMAMLTIMMREFDGNGDNTMTTMMRGFDALSGLWWSAGAWDWKGLRPHKPNRITKQRG